MSERGQSLEILARRREKAIIASKKISSIIPYIGEIIAGKKLAELKGFAYLDRAVEVADYVRYVRDRLKSVTKPRLDQLVRDLDNKLISISREKVGVIRSAVDQSLLPQTVLETAQSFFDEIGKDAELSGDVVASEGETEYDPEIRNYLESLGEAEKALVKRFLASPAFDDLLKVVGDFRPQGARGLRIFDMKLRGAVFEYLGFYYLSDAYSGDSSITILSPREVFEFYKVVNPTKSFGSGIDSYISDVTHPDGFVLHDRGPSINIEAIIDYKHWVKFFPRQQFARQYEGFKSRSLLDFSKEGTPNYQVVSRRSLSKVRPDINKPVVVSPNFKIIYVVPRNSRVVFPENSKVIRVPISSGHVGRLCELMIEAAIGRKGNSEEINSYSESKILPESIGEDAKNDKIGDVFPVLPEVSERVRYYFEKANELGAPRNVGAGELWKYFGGGSLGRMTQRQINIAEAAGLIKPRRVRGQVRLKHIELVILAYWLDDAGGDIAKAKRDGVVAAANSERERREAEKSL